MARLGAGLGLVLLGWTQRATTDRERYGLSLVPLARHRARREAGRCINLAAFP
jgi:hypothetical protein